ncbi:MAG: hypothetical protein IPG32_03305 [Saprospirales bacterium]|jgi:hypothetical protein|nr:hypothetical protein [Saprospirales bacterium]
MKALVLPSILVLALFYLFLPGCTKEYVEDINGVCFERDVLPIFLSSCAQSGCHNSIDQEEGYDLTSYESITSHGIVPGNYKKSKIYESLTEPFGDEIMPPAPNSRLSSEQISTIALWIEQGAHNTACSSGVCDTTGLTFSADIQPILQTNCISCHSGSAPSGNIDYSNYTGVKATITDNSLLGSVTHSYGYSPMPQGANKLSNCDIAILQAWVQSGAPNN